MRLLTVGGSSHIINIIKIIPHRNTHTEQSDLDNPSQRLEIVKLTMKTNHINFEPKLARTDKKRHFIFD